MTDPSDPSDLGPEPASTGVLSEQEAPPPGDAIELTQTGAIAGSGIRVVTLTGTLAHLVERGGIRGEAANLLLQVSTTRLESELDAARTQLDDVRNKYFAEHETRVRLEERQNLQPLRHTLISLGKSVWARPSPFRKTERACSQLWSVSSC